MVNVFHTSFVLTNECVMYRNNNIPISKSVIHHNNPISISKSVIHHNKHIPNSRCVKSNLISH